MKSFKKVEETRREYHKDATSNSVHRSSLCVPELPDTTVDISFLNHFLLKRGYPHVACRVTALDLEGQRIGSRLFPVDEARVYTLPLSEIFEDQVNTYLVEFFTADNLFVPFPAVMVNHRGGNFLNSVHAYNRVLNDVFEDDAINANPVAEASIDVWLDAETDTFLAFATGPQSCRGRLEFELANESGGHATTIEIDQPRLTNRIVSLTELFPKAPRNTTGVLKVRQPRQPMFYGRLFAGRRKTDGAFSANHSYYDSSTTAEYWGDNRPSRCIYPYFRDLENTLRMYPIMSAGRLALSLEFFAADGASLGSCAVAELTSPGDSFADISVNACAADLGIDADDISSYVFAAAPLDGMSPTRVNHQLVHGSGGLASSVNMSLDNPNMFHPKGGTGFKWGQVPLGADFESWLGFANNRPGGEDCDMEVVFYGAGGELATRNWTIPANGALSINPADELAAELERADGNGYLWYVARASQPDLCAYTVSRHRESGHCSGEHNF